MARREQKKQADDGKQLFGTFGGVYTPSILTILGIIMFYRATYVIGQAGISGTLMILLIAEAITLMTALSLGAVATNTPVKGGGAYFLISRALGAEFGGAIGMALFLAQALSVPFYIIGFASSFVESFPVFSAYSQWIALGTAVALFVINYVGSGWAIKAQYVIMTILMLSIISFMGGAALLFKVETLVANWAPRYTDGLNFWKVFAIYFPAVTGILAGVNMSGDLKDPARSLVKGTLAAMGTGFAIYLLQIFVCGAAFGRATLIEQPYQILLHNALLGTAFLVVAGVSAASLSSGLGSYMGAPRVLQAMARDKIFPCMGFFAKGTPQSDEPRAALWLTLVLTMIVIVFLYKSFDLVAAVLGMFFLCTYGMINLAAFVESFGANPSFRPRFRFYHWGLSLLGALVCLVVMVLVDPLSALVASLMIGLLYYAVSCRVFGVTFGDARRGFLFSLIAKNLRKLRDMPCDPKNWRPVLLVLIGNPRRHANQLQYAVWLEGGRGLVSAAQILVGEADSMVERRKAAHELMAGFMQEHQLNVFAEVVVTDELDTGIRLLTQAHSIGPIKPNTVILGWPHEQERIVPYVRHLRTIKALGRSVVSIIDRGLPEEQSAERRIDLWWRGKENGSLMIILAHLLTCNWDWRRARVQVIRLIKDEAGRAPAREVLEKLIQSARVDAQVKVVVSHESFDKVLYQYSRSASVVILGFEPPADDQAEAVFKRFELFLQGLPTSIMVSSNGDADVFA